MNEQILQEELCRQLCADIQLVRRENGMLMISTPFTYPDGDQYSIYLKEIEAGLIRISDEANTVMKLSYDTPNVEKYFKSSRGKLMQHILRENGIQESNGNFFIETSTSKLSESIFRFGQGLSEIYDLSYIGKERSASTFYKDLEKLLTEIANGLSLTLDKDYVVPSLENAENYVIDYSFRYNGTPNLFLFGIPTADKAKLVTITLQHLLLNKIRMPSLLIFKQQEELPAGHLSRLMDANVRGSQVSSIVSRKAIESNIVEYTQH